jgi:DNA-binding transcriptional ArsR family regulator
VYDGNHLTLIPSVFVWPGLIIMEEAGDSFGLTYAARGVAKVWEGLPSAETADNDLGALLGRNRAEILRRLDIPLTTTQLARELDLSPGTVNQHLSVLKRNGLLSSWRSGRSVLYRRTALASSVIAAGDHQRSSAAVRSFRAL